MQTISTTTKIMMESRTAKSLISWRTNVGKTVAALKSFSVTARPNVPRKSRTEKKNTSGM